jgi:glycosyltransferase involved in cell wall biosynthesis
MKLSVITPSLNQAAYLPATLASVRAAAERAPECEVEHIIQDGGSNDGTLAILEAQSFARWTSEADRGQTDAINRGLSKASGEVLCYLCSDDLWEPDCVRLVSRVFEENLSVDVVYGDYYFLEGRSGWKRRKTAGPFSIERLYRTNFPSQPATFWRRNVYERFGGLDESLRYCMDREYWLRIAPRTSWYYIREPLASMRLHTGSKTGSRICAMWWETARMSGKYISGPRPWLQALGMQTYGWIYYRMKRAWFERIGMRRASS